MSTLVLLLTVAGLTAAGRVKKSPYMIPMCDDTKRLSGKPARAGPLPLWGRPRVRVFAVCAGSRSPHRTPLTEGEGAFSDSL